MPSMFPYYDVCVVKFFDMVRDRRFPVLILVGIRTNEM